MAKVNENYLKLPGSYLFSTVAKKAAAYTEANPDKEVIKMSIGDVTKPLAPAVIEAMHKAVDEMGTAEGFHGYGPEQGYDFLRNKIVEKDYAARGIDVKADEIFVSDGAKSDCGNIGDIFSVDNKVAVCDPVYPVYVDTNAMAGRAGDFTDGKWNNLVYMPCKEENGFMPQLPEEKVDIIYLCFPNNPIGVAAMTRLFFTTVRMRHLLQTLTYRTAFMKLRVQKKLRLNSEVFQRKRDLRVQDVHTLLYRMN